MLYNKHWDTKVEPVLDEVGQIMWKAADYLETHKWGKGDFILANGAVCLMGALMKIETGNVYSYYKNSVKHEGNMCPIADMAIIRIQEYLKLTHQGDVYEWNDDDNRRKSEVIAVLRDAAKLK